MVDRNRHTAIPQLRQQADRILQAMMGQAVGVVAKIHASILRYLPSRRHAALGLISAPRRRNALLPF